MAAYVGNRQEATDSALDADPVATAIMQLMHDQDEWTGSATELWTALNELVDEGVRYTKTWPGAPNALTSRLKRLAPTLRGIGIEYAEDRGGRTRKKVLTKNKPAKDRHDRHHRHTDKKDQQNSTFGDDGPGDGLTDDDGVDRHHDDPTEKTVTPENPIDKGNEAHNDGRGGDDGDMRTDSKPACKHEVPGGCRRCRQQIERLVHEGMSREMAREEILGEGTEL